MYLSWYFFIDSWFILKNIYKFATDNPIWSPKRQILAIAEVRKGWEAVLTRSTLIVGNIYMIRRLLDALFLMYWNFATFNHSQEWGNSRCPWVCITASTVYLLKVGNVSAYTISAWASALLVQLWWAMRKPQCVERVTGTDSHAFFVCEI